MIREVIYEIKALYRDDFRVTGFRLGQGEPSVCIIGSLRGNEFQQIYVCSQLIRKLSILESKGRITEGKEILVIPCGNPYSVNTQKRFWTIDNTDINRMFPGMNWEKQRSALRMAFLRRSRIIGSVFSSRLSICPAILCRRYV